MRGGGGEVGRSPTGRRAAPGVPGHQPLAAEHPLHLDYLQIIYYLTDVEPGCHHFTISPEPADGDVLDTDGQLARGGSVPFYGKAGTGIVFNAATLHGVTLAATARERRILQIYYGHAARPPLAEVTLMPPRLWRDHPDPEVRRFYGKLNRYTRDMLGWMCDGA